MSQSLSATDSEIQSIGSDSDGTQDDEMLSPEDGSKTQSVVSVSSNSEESVAAFTQDEPSTHPARKRTKRSMVIVWKRLKE